MKKLLIALTLVIAGAGCQVTPPAMVTHLVFTQQDMLLEGHPIDNPLTNFEVYYTNSAARLHVSDPTPETLELLSLFNANEEYVTFLENNDKRIIKVDLANLPDHGNSFFNSVVEKVLAPNPDWIDITAKAPYTVDAPYYENEVDPPITQRVTLDSQTQNISKVEIIDSNNQVMEIFTVIIREEIPATSLPSDYFTVERWTDDLPGEGYTEITDDLQ